MAQATYDHADEAPVPVTVVVVTRNRRDELMTTLAHLVALPERPDVVVVDNASDDGTAGEVRHRYPSVAVIALDENRGAAGRNIGVEQARTPWVAFADDDSWWAPGALGRAVGHLAAHPDVALVAARILLGRAEREEPLCADLAASPLGTAPGDPGPTIVGFIACGAVVDRSAFLEAGGFHPRFGVGGEESLLALDLASAGLRCVYTDDVVAHHHPSPVRDRARRERIVVRNHLWTTWMRRRAGVALAESWRSAARAVRHPATRAGLLEALADLPGVLGERRVVDAAVERSLRRVERAP